MKAVRYILFAPLVWLVVALSANAQGAQCGGYEDVLAGLRATYDERVVWVGELGASGHLVITAKVDGSSWSALLVRAELACMVWAGTKWAAMATGEDI